MVCYSETKHGDYNQQANSNAETARDRKNRLRREKRASQNANAETQLQHDLGLEVHQPETPQQRANRLRRKRRANNENAAALFEQQPGIMSTFFIQ